MQLLFSRPATLTNEHFQKAECFRSHVGIKKRPNTDCATHAVISHGNATGFYSCPSAAVGLHKPPPRRLLAVLRELAQEYKAFLSADAAKRDD